MFVFFALCENTLLIVQRYKINYSGLKIVLSLQRFLSVIKFFNMDIHEYRQLILNELLARKTEKGEPIISELEANNLLNELTDEDLIMGMPFNEPKDIADIIIQIK